MDLRGQEIKNTYGNVVTIGSSAGSPTTGELTNGQNSSFTSTYLSGNFGIGSAPTTYGSLNVLALGSAGSAGGGIIDIVGTSGRLASIYTEASGKLVLTADPTNGEAGTSMEFNVDGSNAMFINSSRNVGIGLVSPTELLHVAGNLKLSDGADRSIKGPANANLIISNSASSSLQGIKFSTDGGTTTDVFIQDGGNVGIGTSSPNAVLDIQNVNPQIQFTDSVNTSAYSRILGTDAGSLIIDADKGNAGVNSAIIFNIDGGSEKMRIDSSGNVGIGTSSPLGKLNVNGGTGDGSSYDTIFSLTRTSSTGNQLTSKIVLDDKDTNWANLIFKVKTTPSAGESPAYYTDALTIDNQTANVGIGTISPANKLHVVGSSSDTAGTGLLRIEGGGGGGNVSWTFRSTVTNNDLTLDRQYGGSYYQALTFQRSSGNVGIGTTTPETKLDVDGDIQTAAPETSTNAAWKLGNVGLGGVEVGPIDYITVSVGGFVVKLPIAIFPETQAFYDRVIADGGTFEGLLGYESAVTILKAQ